MALQPYSSKGEKDPIKIAESHDEPVLDAVAPDVSFLSKHMDQLEGEALKRR